MKFIILAAVVAVATAAKLTGNELGPPVIAILRDDRVAPQGGAYQQEVETENGIYQQESGQPGSFGQSNTQGAFSYVADDGSQIQLTYIADENGFQPQGAHLPTPPPLPEHVYELLRIAEEQRAAGITFEK